VKALQDEACAALNACCALLQQCEDTLQPPKVAPVGDFLSLDLGHELPEGFALVKNASRTEECRKLRVLHQGPQRLGFARACHAFE
jgi:hypothetical protein